MVRFQRGFLALGFTALWVTLSSASLWTPQSLPYLIEQSEDVILVTVDDVVGPRCGQKAIATLRRGLKGVLDPGSIELPFLYSSCFEEEPDENGMVSGWRTHGVSFSFEKGRHYLVLVIPTTSPASDVRPANTSHEVLRYPDVTFFELDGLEDPRIRQVDLFVKLAARKKVTKRRAALEPLLRHDDPWVRRMAVETLRDFDWRITHEALFRALRDEDDAIRNSAALQVTRSDTPEATAELLAMLDREPVSNIRGWAMQALARRGATDAIPKLLARYPSADLNERYGILAALRVFGDPSVFPQLVEYFGEGEDPMCRKQLVQAMGALRTREVASWVANLIEDPDRVDVRPEAVRALAELGYDDYAELLVRLSTVPCEESLPNLPAAVIDAVQKLGTTAQLLEVCRHYAGCFGQTFHDEIARALRREGSIEAIPLLEELKNETLANEAYLQRIIKVLQAGDP